MAVPTRVLALAAVLALALPLLATGNTAPAAPSFNSYTPPAGLGADAGEPSIGVDWATGRVMMLAGLQTLRVGFDTASPPAATWSDVTFFWTGFTSADPILFTDAHTGRTFVSQLAGTCSLMAYTDDDGATWVPSPLGCGAGSGFDHQTVGGGAFHAPLVGTPLYADAVWYCSQEALAASCAQSQDGGLTFGPAVPIYTITCIGLHGHIRVAPDGTAYVPNEDCNGQQAVVASSDNGLTWAIRRVPGSSTHDKSDPSVAVGSGGRVYFCYQDGDGHPKAVASTDQGRTWGATADLGAAFGIQNSEFPAVIAGDDDRAACAFLGTPTAGDDQASAFKGVWHLYVSFTYDGGSTWQTVDATPGDPVQRGCIWLGGGNNACRNLLDFMDISVGKDGRVFVGYADGCVSAQCIGPSGQPADSRASKATIARQAAGSAGLFAAAGVLP